MKTIWEYSLETESLRVLQCSRQISVGFYRANNFCVLPYRETNNKYSDVVFPDLLYYKIPRFWDKVKRVNIGGLPIKADKKLIKGVQTILADANFPEPNIAFVKNNWKKAKKEIIATTEKIVPHSRGAIKKITIYPTLFGTNTSFDVPKKFPTSIGLYLREDQDIYTITEALLTALTRNKIQGKIGANWAESEFLVDWLLTESVISDVLKKYQPKTNWVPTIKQVRAKQKVGILKTSENFYKRLGMPLIHKPFSVNGKVPLLNGKPLENLTKREQEVLVAMINKEGNILTFDEFDEILFTNEENFSLYAISKAIQRLRDKLEKNSISGSYIQTLRGKGYLLRN